MVTAGKYRAKAVEAVVTQAGEKQTPLAKVVFELVEGQFAGERVEWDGWLTEKARARTFEGLALCGWDGDTSREDWDQLPGALTHEVIVDCKQETFTTRSGESRTAVKVAWVNPLRSAPKPVDRNFLKTFGAQVRGEALAVAKRIGGTAAAAPAPAKPVRKPAPVVDELDDAIEPTGDVDDEPFDFGHNAPPARAASGARPNRRAGF
ncbi:MAG: hypothetical protein EBR82_12305 [Caulobacteraceae bacterium]|nr:hypothetical protein [Caulobacteraceae bacterium]